MFSLRSRLFALPACIALVALAGCQSMQDLFNAAPQASARVIGAELRDLKLNSLDMIFSIQVNNPYTVDLPVAKLAYVLDSGGKNLLEGSIEPTGAIAKHSSSVLQVPVRVTFDSLLDTLKNVKPGSVVPWRAQFIVAVDAPLIGRMNLPLERSGEMPVPAVPRIEVVGFDVGSLSLEKAEATATLKITNTNRFALNPRQLAFTLDLDNNPVLSTSVSGPGKLAPGESATIKVPMSFMPRSFGLPLFNLLKGGTALYHLTGSLDAGTDFGMLSAPFTNSGELRVTR